MIFGLFSLMICYLVGISTNYDSSYFPATTKKHHDYDYFGIYSNECTCWNSACLTVSRSYFSSLSVHTSLKVGQRHPPELSRSCSFLFPCP